MFVLIAGGGRTGAQLATVLVAQNHEVHLVEQRRDVLARIHRELPTEVIVEGSALEPEVLEQAGIRRGAGAGGLHDPGCRKPGAVLPGAHTLCDTAHHCPH